MKLAELDAAYLAGLLDGEGTIGVRPRPNGYVNLELGICMTTPKPLRWARAVTGLGSIYHRPERRARRRDAWFWKVSSCAAIAEVLQQVLPHLKVKAAEARGFLVLAHLRRLKSSTTGPARHRAAEHAVARILAACKGGDEQTAYSEAMDLTIYLRQVIAERDESSGSVIHLMPLAGAGVTPCCGRPPVELPRIDRIALADHALVTCPGGTR